MHPESLDAHAEAGREIGILKCLVMWLRNNISCLSKRPGPPVGGYSMRSIIIDHGGLSKGHQDNVTAPIVTFSTVAENEPTLQMK
jgi:hypothetical protein